MGPSADRNLLFGILALQMDFISRDALIAAMNAWVLEKDKSLGRILVERGDLGADDFALLDPLVAKHVERHGGDPERSLESLSSVSWIRRDLQAIGDPALHASLARLGAAPDGQADPMATVTHAVGAPSSAGQRFRILRPHASGGLGEVYVARDEELNREVALKQIKGGYADHPESRLRFLLEAEVTGGLEHPGIVPVYGLGHYPDGRPFYAMRFIRGDSLKEAIAHFHGGDARGRSPGERALGLQKLLRRFLDVCNAVAYAHSRGVLHRDIKPGNILVGQYGETLLVDWGLAKVIGTSGSSAEATLRPPSASGSSATLPGSAIGTPAFMSPEQAAGRLDQLGPASDVYSLGATLYCLLTGKAPIVGWNVEDVMGRVRRGEFPLPRHVQPDVPRPLEAICLHAMALKPADRYPTPRALAEDLERWLADEPVSAWPEPLTVRAGRWLRRHRTLAATAAGSVLVGLVALGIAYSRESAINDRLARSNQALDQANRQVTAINQRLQATNTALGLAHERVTKAKAESDRRLDQTLQAIEDYYTGVNEEVLLDQEELQQLRTRLLEKPRQFYERLAAELESSSSPDLRGRALLARGRSNLGRILQVIGRPDDARKQYEAAVALYADVERDEADSLEILEGRASSCKGLAIVLASTGHYPDAAGAIDQAIALHARLSRSHPDSDLFQNELASDYMVLADVLVKTGNHAKAIEWLREAVRIREHVASAHPDVSRSGELLALAHQALGIRLRDLGKLGEAEASLRKAIAIGTRRLADGSPSAELHLALATSHSDLGIVLQDQGDARGAAASYRQAIDFAGRLVAAHPNVPGYRHALAKAYSNLGRTLMYARANPESARAYRDGIPIWAQLTSDHPDIPDYRRGLADHYSGLGVALLQNGDADGAADSFHKAIAIHTRLVADHPNVPDYQDRLASAWGNLGNLLGQARNFRGAADAFRKVIALQTKLVAGHPDVPEYQTRLATSFHLLGTAFQSLGQVPDSVEALRQAIQHQRKALERSPQGDLIRGRLGRHYLSLAASLRVLGRLEECAEALRRGRALGLKQPLELYNEACQLSLLVPLLRDPAQKQAMAGEAVETLRAAIAAGWNHAQHTSRDPDLAPLHGRDDFRRLLAELFDRGFPPDPFAKLEAIREGTLSPRMGATLH